MIGRRIRRLKGGAYAVDLPPVDRELLRSLPASMRRAFTEGSRHDDAALARLYPAAYSDPDQEELEAEYREMVDDELTAGRLAALDTLEQTADAERLEEAQLLSWLRAINDSRLFLGTRLGVTEDPADRAVADDHPDAQAIAVYDHLSWLEEQLVEALSGGLPR